MFRKMIALCALALLVAGAAVAGDLAWFDMDKCDMCKGISNHAEMMENMTWEQHNITNGVVAITTVDKKYIDEYRKAHATMEETVSRLQKGEKMELCGSCAALGACMMKGVNEEYVETTHGDVWIVTSENAEVVADLQNWAKRNNEEMAKMKAKS